MRAVTFSMGMSLDGYILDPDGGLDWAAPDEEVFRFAREEVRALAVHLLGRRLHETMLHWERVPEESLDDDERAFAELWQRLPKVVFSSSLTEVEGTSTLAPGDLADEISRWRNEPGDGNVGIGGAALAARAAELGLLDEYRIRVHPVLLGGGTPFFPHAGRRTDLELLETRSFDCGVQFLRYRMARSR